MCDFGSSASTSTTPSGVSPTAGASTSGTVTCCPDVAEFKKKSTRTDYFGFDDKTCLHAAAADRYWVPATKSKTAPTNRLTRDGAVWLSVETGKTTKTTIDFTNNIGCITNCTYEVKPASKATVLTASIGADRATFEIKGDAEGDCTVVVKCDGKDVGWVHVAVWDQLAFTVGICEVNQSITTGTGAAATTALTLPRPALNVARYQSFFDDCYRDAAVKVTLTGLPRHDVPATVDLSAGGGFFDANGQMESPAYRARRATGIYPVTDAIHTAVSAANPGYDKYLFLMVPPGARRASKRYLNGFARGIGGDYAIFFNVNSGTYSTAAHEFGHLIDLRHPNDSSGANQYAAHLRAGSNNVATNDTKALMGYGNPRTSRKRIRYEQWKAVSGR